VDPPFSAVYVALQIISSRFSFTPVLTLSTLSPFPSAQLPFLVYLAFISRICPFSFGTVSNFDLGRALPVFLYLHHRPSLPRIFQAFLFCLFFLFFGVASLRPARFAMIHELQCLFFPPAFVLRVKHWSGKSRFALFFFLIFSRLNVFWWALCPDGLFLVDSSSSGLSTTLVGAWLLAVASWR